MTDRTQIVVWIALAMAACLIAGAVMRPDVRDAVGGAVLQIF